MNIIKSLLKCCPIHKEGYILIAIFAACALFAYSFSQFFGSVALILTILCIYFFRDPERVTPHNAEDFILSPADGIVQSITVENLPKELERNTQMNRVSIFLNVLDVHVNRIAVSGKVTKVVYNPGKFFNASLDKASIYNERNSMLIETKDGAEVAVVQIAGLIARRIVCDTMESDNVSVGDRFGIIKFGSRVDIYLPKTLDIKVKEGQRMVGGETIIASLD
ncbi:MAG: phosphatidylserine decarboxylase [Proteobacteria bacterium]|nr:phosphatidylserine decarboxylase [Pseudomonadota bacterium]